jgi:hypothetical protein
MYTNYKKRTQHINYRKKNDETLGDVLKRMVETYRLKGKLNELHLRESWTKIMGNSISKNTTDISLSNRRLFIKIQAAALKNELIFAKDKIKNIMNKELGEQYIDEVIIR